jgi:decaprenylphospho-beta-D-ribofuranose 2-oxidase
VTRELLTGWGRTAPTAADVVHPTSVDELAAGLERPPERGVAARGLGRSYGDPAQNAGGRVLDTTGARGLIDLDLNRGVVTAAAGTSLHDLMRWLVPLGWFVPVTPGTRYVTVGGAIANDIHGKNHHGVGSWCNHLLAMTMATPAGGKITVTPQSDPDLFWATAGGVGLTGLVLDATFQLHRIETSRLVIDTDRTRDLDEVMALMTEGDDRYEYSVAWIDLMARGASVGRSILDRGRFAHVDELSAKQQRDPLAYHAAAILPMPFVAPPKLLNPLTVRAFNEVWYRRAPRRRRGHVATIPAFFHPLDAIHDWNRGYGPAGFLQWQCVVPIEAGETMRHIIEAFSASATTSLVNVLKRFGPGNEGMLSFPQPGWTLSVDLSADAPGLARLLDRLDDEVLAAGGRLYLAKDSRMRPSTMEAGYARLDEWRAVRRRVDPDGILQHDLGRRLGLV